MNDPRTRPSEAGVSRAPRVLVAITDLFFSSKIDAALAAAPSAPGSTGAPPSGLPAEGPVARARRDVPLIDQLRASGARRLLVDLAGPRAIDAVREIKADPALRSVEVVGYCRHTALATIEAAKAAGCDRVLTQGEFAAQLAELLA